MIKICVRFFRMKMLLGLSKRQIHLNFEASKSLLKGHDLGALKVKSVFVYE